MFHLVMILNISDFSSNYLYSYLEAWYFKYGTECGNVTKTSPSWKHPMQGQPCALINHTKVTEWVAWKIPFSTA